MFTTSIFTIDSAEKLNRQSFKNTSLLSPEKESVRESVNKPKTCLDNVTLSYDVSFFISEYLMKFKLNEIQLFNTRCSNKIIFNIPLESKVIVNYKKINDYRRINRFFEDMNTLLPINGLFISHLETHTVRKERILAKVPKFLKGIYYTLDFAIHRIIPKIKLLSSLYFKTTKGRDRALTRAEALGRLYACGFEIIDEKTIDNELHFVAKKIKNPNYDSNATYGPFIHLKRVGKKGQVIKVLKLRTMHPYAEYLQQYIYNKNKLSIGGKINNDFRVSKLGRLLRKYWIDEIPMLINLLKGDLKFIGTRPLSQHYFSLYPKSLQEKRIQFKPGLLPPFYADMPKTLDDIVESEKTYLNAYEENPLLTDIKYFFKIINNILFAGKRSG